eukprot:SAG31_NODE_25421_length_461_cov_2.560773_1_plen_20_part_01
MNTAIHRELHPRQFEGQSPE